MKIELLKEEESLDCTSCQNPEQCRICVYQTLTNPDVDDFEGTYDEFIKKYFQTEESSIDFYNKMVSFGYTNKGKNEFFKTYCCDLDWAKQQNYCKTAAAAKEKDKWYVADDENKQKFIKKYPCISSQTINDARQKETNDGTLIVLNVTVKNERVWMYMLDSTNPELTSKYNGLVKKEDGTDEGKFECQGEIVDTPKTNIPDNKLPPD